MSLPRTRSFCAKGKAVLFLCLWMGANAHGLLAQAAPNQTGPGVGEHSTPLNTVPEKREQTRNENDEYRHSAAVVKIGSLIGLNAEQAATTFEVLNFVVLAIGVGYLAGRILPKKFGQRSTAIQKDLVEARTATEESSARLNAVEARLSRLDADIESMRLQIEAEIGREEQRIKTSLEDETAKIVAAAESEIQAATTAAHRELQRHAAELAIQKATQQLLVTAETDRLLVQGFAERLLGDKGGQN